MTWYFAWLFAENLIEKAFLQMLLQTTVAIFSSYQNETFWDDSPIHHQFFLWVGGKIGLNWDKYSISLGALFQFVPDTLE